VDSSIEHLQTSVAQIRASLPSLESPWSQYTRRDGFGHPNAYGATSILVIVKCVLHEPALGGYDGSLDDDPKSGVTYNDDSGADYIFINTGTGCVEEDDATPSATLDPLRTVTNTTTDVLDEDTSGDAAHSTSASTVGVATSQDVETQLHANLEPFTPRSHPLLQDASATSNSPTKCSTYRLSHDIVLWRTISAAPMFTLVSSTPSVEVEVANISLTSEDRALQRRLLKFFAARHGWRRTGGRDHIGLEHHPSGMLDARYMFWPCVFMLCNFGRLPSSVKLPLRVHVLFTHIQKMMTGDSVVMAETGDSWFSCHKLKLPEGYGYEFQMQYGLIGWSMGALLGYAQGANHKLFSPVTALHPLVVVCCDHGSIMDDAAGFSDELVVTSMGVDCHIIASYHMWPFGQTGTGHFSPIGGYHVRHDMVLILYVARFIPLHFLWKARNTTNDSTGLLRGSMLISRKVAKSSLLYTVSCRDENWKSMSKFCVEDLPSILKAGIGAGVGLVTSGLSAVSSGQGIFSVFVWDPGDSGLVTSSLSAVSSDQDNFSVFVWDPGDRGLVTYGLRVVSIA
jgi:hypothetical protein